MSRRPFAALLAACALACAGCPAAPHVARKVAPTVAQYLLGAGVEKFWTPNGERPKSLKTVAAKLAHLELQLAGVNPEYAGQVRALREALREDTPLADYKQLAKGAVERIEALEARVARLEKRADETDAKIADFEKRLGSLEQSK